MENSRPKVVITGMGVVSVLGCTLEKYWNGLLEGRSGISKITQFDASELPCQIAGEINDFDPGAFFSFKEARRMPRSSQMALASAINAVKDAGLPETMPDAERAAVVYGTAMGGLDFVDIGIHTIRNSGFKSLSPFFAGGSIPNYPAFVIGRNFQCLGFNSTITTACASSTQTIGEGAELIRRGVADIVIVGGTESINNDFVIGGFASMRALPTNYNDDPTKASRPFDLDREGFVLSEGAATLVLESEQHAKSRNARIHAEVAGHASSSDGYHMAVPAPDAAGALRAMKWALKDSGLESDEIDYINAHGTSTPLNDKNETLAIKRLFGEHAYTLSVSSTKSMVGHAMGASGALEAIVCALVMQNSIIPPTINYEHPDPELDLDYTVNTPRKREVNTTLSNSFGLGGQNACLVLKKYTTQEM